MIDRGGARRSLAFGTERRATGTNVPDGTAARLRTTEPGAGIAEIRPREFAEADDLGPEFSSRGKVFGLDRDVIEAVDGRDRQSGFGSHGVISSTCVGWQR